VSKRPVTKSPVILLTPRDGSRRIPYNVPPGVDRIYISPSGTTADISKVRIIVDDGDVLDLSEFVPAEIFPPPKRITLEWDPSEDGKTVQFLFGREYYKRAITYAEIVRSWDIAPKLDVISQKLNSLAMLERWGYAVEPTWIYGAEITAPPANTALVSKTVSSGMKGLIYGLFITAQEANDFKVNWTSGGVSRSLRIVMGGKGTVVATFEKPLNEGLPADAGTTITITNVNAGGVGMIYQAGILYAEVV
jgi:hypothetical protein